MTARPPPMIAGRLDEPSMRDERFKTPMIPGAREPGKLETFGVPAVVYRESPSTMDAATIAARQREGGGAPNQRRPPREGSVWADLGRRLRGFLGAGVPERQPKP